MRAIPTIMPTAYHREARLASRKTYPPRYLVGGIIAAMAIGHRIKKAREDAGLTQRELAKRIRLSPGLIGQWESHRKKPGRDILPRLADALVLDITVLLNDSGDQRPGVLIRDPKQLALIRRFKQLSPRQQESILELLGVSADVWREVQKQS
jgi:transcriptional regulator with XRE-family HTH domain